MTKQTEETGPATFQQSEGFHPDSDCQTEPLLTGGDRPRVAGVSSRPTSPGGMAGTDSPDQAAATHDQLIRSEERQRIVRDIHDELGALLTVLKIELSLLKVHQCTQTALGLVDDAIDSVRRLAHNGRPLLLDRLNIWEAIEQLAKDFQNRVHVTCAVSMAGKRPVVGMDLSVALLRIIQEALTNVAQHAKATEVWITTWSSDKEIIACVQDDGQGMDVQPLVHTTLGLSGMRERAKQCNGSVEIFSQPGGGTNISVRFPLQEGSSQASLQGADGENPNEGTTSGEGVQVLRVQGDRHPAVGSRVIRDGFSMPENDYRILAELRAKFLPAGLPTGKRHLLRAALRILQAAPYDQQIAYLGGLEAVKLGRPPKSISAETADPGAEWPRAFQQADKA